MLSPRIIPCLLLSNGALVKTQGFKNPRYVGDPINAVRIFNEKEADELTVFDISASMTNSDPNYQLIEKLAAECRMPLCYGGGIKNIKQARRIISFGIEKVALSSAAFDCPELITDIAQEAGSQSVVVVIDVKYNSTTGEYEVFRKNSLSAVGIRAVDFAIQAERLGAGEIVVNSADLDGVMTGYDLILAKQMKDAIGVPLTILGGAGRLSDMELLFQECGIVGAGAGSLFVFKGAFRAVLINYPTLAQRYNLYERSLLYSTNDRPLHVF